MKTERCALFHHPICLGAMLLWILGLVSSAFTWPDVVTQGLSPEVEKLGFLVGTWKIERAAHKTAYQPAEERQSTIQTGEWLYGRLFVLCLLGLTPSTGPYSKVSIFGYDPEAGTYFCDVYMGMGQRTYYTGSRAGNTWTFVSDSKKGGRCSSSAGPSSWNRPVSSPRNSSIRKMEVHGFWPATPSGPGCDRCLV